MANIEHSDIQMKFQEYFYKNYYFLWITTMIQKAQSIQETGATIITGSSYALNGIQESAWKNAVNLSMHSQDLYYDFLLARKAIEYRNVFDKCLIVGGYYISHQDMSLEKSFGRTIVSQVYYPIFHDAHNWNEPSSTYFVENLSEDEEIRCKRTAMDNISSWGSYYHDGAVERNSFMIPQGITWDKMTESDRNWLGVQRISDHSKIFHHQNSFLENKEILKDFVHFLSLHNITPIMVVPPFSNAYNKYILDEMKDFLIELVDSVPEAIHYVDFNDSKDIFTDCDFIDTDHLNEQGAKKFSQLLTELFGK